MARKSEDVKIDLTPWYDDMIKLFTQVESEEDMKALFDDMFTQAEIRDFTIRWKLMNDLFLEVNPIPVKKMAETLGICQKYIRLPLTEMTAENTKVLVNAYNELIKG